ncbi:MAG: LytR C-terminal domain-containing protein [Candidatus Zhuqueibacterota bacterium]
MVDKNSVNKKGLRKTLGKETEEKKKKESQQQWQGFLLSVFMYFLIGANLMFVASLLVQKLLARQTPTIVSPIQIERPLLEDRENVIKVEVLNGCGAGGVATQLTDYLRKNNVDVVYFGNFETWNTPETWVIDRRDRKMKKAKTIGDLIGLDDSRIHYQISPERQLDVTIVIGKNYSQLKAFK